MEKSETMNMQDLVFLGIRGSVLALDKNTGARIWETKLKGSSFVTLLVDGARILAGAQGEIFCLDAATGKTLWHDGLSGYGFGLMSIATQNGSADATAIAAQKIREQQEASAAAASSTAAIS
jgi:outer membrane protein assembly factor BamB